MIGRCLALLLAVHALTAPSAEAQQPSSPTAVLHGVHTLRSGIPVTLEVTGCRDPATGGAEGLGVMSILEPGSPSEAIFHSLSPVDQDGSIMISGMPPALSTDVHVLEPRCVRLDDPSSAVVTYPSIAVRGAPDTTPRTRDLATTVAVGSTLRIDGPCTEAASSVLVFFFGPSEEAVLTSYGLEQIRRPVAVGEAVDVVVSANGARPGTYQLRLECHRPFPAGFGPGEELFEQSIDLSVVITAPADAGAGAPLTPSTATAPAPPASQASLPATGSMIGWLALVGTGLIAAGTALVAGTHQTEGAPVG